MLEYSMERVRVALELSAKGELTVTYQSQQISILIDMSIICTDWAMSVKLLNCYAAQSVFKGYMLQITKRDYAQIVGKSVLDLLDKHIDNKKRVELAHARLARAVQTSNLTADQATTEVDARAKAERNPQLGLPLLTNAFPVHDILHAKPRTVTKNLKAIFALCPEYVDILQQHKKLEFISNNLRNGNKLNLTGDIAAYYYRNAATIATLLIRNSINSSTFEIFTGVQAMTGMTNISSKRQTTLPSLNSLICTRSRGRSILCRIIPSRALCYEVTPRSRSIPQKNVCELLI